MPQFGFTEQLRVGRHLFKQAGSFSRHFLRLFSCEITPRRQCPVEHPDYFNPLSGLKMQQHIFAQDQVVTGTRRFEAEQVVLLVKHLVPYNIVYFVRAFLCARIKVLCEQISRDPLQFLVAVYTFAYYFPKKVAAVQVSSVNAQVPERETAHVFRKHYGQGIRLGPHGAAGVPYTDLAETGNRWDHMFYNQFECMQISEKVSKGHF